MKRKSWFVAILLGVCLGIGAVMVVVFNQQRGVVSQPQFTLPYVAPLAEVPDARIVYIVDQSSASEASQRMVSGLTTTFGATVIQDWQAVVELDNLTPIDALIVDASALAQIDQTWVAQRYRQGVVIAGINLDGTRMSALLQDNCMGRDGFARYETGSYFVIASMWLEGASEDTARVLEAYRASCGDVGAENVQAQTSYSARYTTEYLIDDNTQRIFEYLLADHLEN